MKKYQDPDILHGNGKAVPKPPALQPRSLRGKKLTDWLAVTFIDRRRAKYSR